MMLDRQFETYNGVWPDNVKAVTAFVAGCSHWNTLPTPVGPLFVGLDIPAVKVIWDIMKIDLDEDLIQRLQFIQAGAAKVLNGGRS